MRGSDEQTASLFSNVSCEARVPSGQPLRLIRPVVDEALEVLSPASMGFTRGLAGPRSHRGNYRWRCCCRHFTRSAPNGS
jgi:hypothetical protein